MRASSSRIAEGETRGGQVEVVGKKRLLQIDVERRGIWLSQAGLGRPSWTTYPAAPQEMALSRKLHPNALQSAEKEKGRIQIVLLFRNVGSAREVEMFIQ